jgi:EmrB/QacA subfamily drug resistance transporter
MGGGLVVVGMDDKARSRLLLVLFIGVLMAALDIAIVGPALKTMREYFGADDRAGAWIFSIYILFNLVGTPLMAKLSDRFGRRRIYVGDILLFAAGSLVVAAAPSYAILLAGRALQGLAAGGIFPVASAIIGDTFPPEKRGAALGIIGAVFGIAFVIGPFVGGIILALAGWRWLFLINLPIAAVVIALGFNLLPTRRGARLPFDWLGMLVLGLSLASLAYGLNQINVEAFLSSLASTRVLPFLLAAGAGIAVFYLIELRAADPVLRPSLLGSRQLRLANVLSAGAGLGEAGLVFIPTLAALAFGMNPFWASMMVMPTVLALGAGSPMVGRVLDRRGSRLVVVIGAALLALGMATLSVSVMGFFNEHAARLGLFIVAGLVIGAGLAALLGAPMRYIMLNEVPAGDRGSAQAMITIFTSVGQLLSAALIGAVAASAGGDVAGYSAAYMLVAAVALVLTFFARGLKSRAQELQTVAHDDAGTLSAKGA